jgi:hypothetical protein
MSYLLGGLTAGEVADLLDCRQRQQPQLQRRSNEDAADGDGLRVDDAVVALLEALCGEGGGNSAISRLEVTLELHGGGGGDGTAAHLPPHFEIIEAAVQSMAR